MRSRALTLALLTGFVFLAGAAAIFASTREPTYKEAVAHWPDMWRPIAFLGLKDHPDEFAVMWNGNISIDTVTRTDADRRLFQDRADKSLQVSFSIGEKPSFENLYFEDNSTKPSLAGGYLPIAQIRHQKGDLIILQEAFVTDQKGAGEAPGNSPVFLRVVFSVEEPGSGMEAIPLWAQLAKDHIRYSMRTRRNVRIDRVAPLYSKSLRMVGNSIVTSEDKTILYSSGPFKFHGQLPDSLSSVALREAQLDKNVAEFSIPRKKGASLELVFPFLPASHEQVDSLVALPYEQARTRVTAFWREEVARGMQVTTPEPVLNNLWRFNVVLGMITADSYPNGDLVMKISPDHYEAYWPTPNSMQFQELTQQGYLQEVATYLEPFLDAQRRRPVPNTGASFASSAGFISGPNEHLAISWVSDHGAILWAASEYYLLTRDQQFLDSWLPTMLKGLEWIAQERDKTKRRGGRGAGLMPAGRAIDAPEQANFVWSDAWIYRGLDAVSRVLRAINHEEAPRWERERDDYRSTFQRILRDAVRKTIRWVDDSGNQIPFVPWELAQTNDRNLHPYYLDTGPLVLGATGLIDPSDEIMTWTLKWFTEGPDASNISPDWSDYAERSSLPHEMSSAEPCYSWNIYLRYLRNDKNDFLRGFYSLCAGAVSRKFLAGVETRDGIQGVPVLNAVINSHLRNMLVFEDESGEGIHILRSSPSAWLQKGQRIEVKGAQTYFGPVDFVIDSKGDQISAQIKSPSREIAAWLQLHLEHPGRKPIRSLTVNGETRSPTGSSVVEIAQPKGTLEIVVKY